MTFQFNISSAVVDFDYSWVDNSLTASIGGNNIVEVSPVEHYEIEDIQDQIMRDFEKFMAVRFSEWVNETGRHYE